MIPEPVLAEYRALREEQRELVGKLYTFIYWAGASAAAVVAGMATGWGALYDNKLLLVVILSWILPALAVGYVFIWSELVTTMVRAARYLYELESNINEVLSNETDSDLRVGWEHHLWDDSGERLSHKLEKTLRITWRWVMGLLGLSLLLAGLVARSISVPLDSGSFPAFLIPLLGGLVWIVVTIGAKRSAKKRMTEVSRSVPEIARELNSPDVS